MARSSVITVSLTAICLGLGWYVFEEINRPDPPAIQKEKVAAVQMTGIQDKSRIGQKAVVLPPIEAFDEIVSRPLFNVSRRPIAVDDPEPASEPAELNIMLSGIVIGHTQQIAHLRSGADNRTRTLGVGDKIDDWRIESIFPDRVVLRSGSRVETLFMQKPGAQNAGKHQPKATGAKRPSRRAIKRSPRRTSPRFRRNNRRGEQ